jgi:hypothetical protein
MLDDERFDDRRDDERRWRRHDDAERARRLNEAIRRGEMCRADWIAGVPPSASPPGSPPAPHEDSPSAAVAEAAVAVYTSELPPEWSEWLLAELRGLDLEDLSAAEERVAALRRRLEECGFTELSAPLLVLESALCRAGTRAFLADL